MAVFAHVVTFMQFVRAVNTSYSRFRTSSLAPLVAVLNDPAGTTLQVVAEIVRIRGLPDAVYVNKANKYKKALHYLQRMYPVPRAQWVPLYAQRARAVRYTQAAMPVAFNPLGPGMYNQTHRIHPVCQWEGAPNPLSVEDFIYTTAGAVGVVMIHLTGTPNGIYERVDGMRVVDHMKSVLTAIEYRNGGVCALNIGAAPLCPDLQAEFNLCANMLVIELGARHMGGVHAAFNTFVTGFATIVVMGFDADICVRANLFGTAEHVAGSAVGASSVAPLTTQADVITSRAMLVTVGQISGVEYGLIQGL
ncbi:hypothetical protein [Iodobacter sp.]|uniref:hypothetical protein n=1 Tax=Iodobacter sp. TaxID=1915058 RepID=UPI0025F165E4|nr:hypothetical protein [Iodobacter sp.]